MTQKKQIDQDLQQLWHDYKKTKDRELKDKLVRRYLHLVRYTAERVAERLPHSIQVEELVSFGLCGLLEAIDRFDLARGIKFESYCRLRIEGAMIDELRHMDWLPRTARQKVNKLEDASERLESRLERPPTDAELCNELKIDISQLDELYKSVNTSTLFSMQKSSQEDETSFGIEALEDKRSANPSDDISKKDLLDFIKKNLTKKEQCVMMLYYFNELTMKEIGRVLDLSESRVSQIHARMIVKLRVFARKKFNTKELT